MTGVQTCALPIYMDTDDSSNNSEEKVVKIDVRDSIIGELEVSNIRELSLTDSVINIKIGRASL